MLTGVFCSTVSITLLIPLYCGSPTDALTQLLDIQIRDLERVLLDELAARLDLVAHEDGEDVVCGDRVLDAHLQELALRGIHRRLPELFRIHLPEPLVALDDEALLPRLHQIVEQLFLVADRLLGSVLDDDERGLRDLRDVPLEPAQVL